MTEGHEGDLRLEHLFCEDTLRELGMSCLEKAPGRPWSNLPVPKVGLQESWKGTSDRVCGPTTEEEKACQNVARGPRGEWARSWGETAASCHHFLQHEVFN